MDEQKVAYFHSEYLRMSEEELAHLVVVRGRLLSDEAIAALRRVLQGRNASFEVELDAKVEDLRSQAAALQHERERQATVNRQIPRAMLIVALAAVIIFVTAAVFSKMT